MCSSEKTVFELNLIICCLFFFYPEISALPDRIIIHFCVELKPTYLPGSTKQNPQVILPESKHEFFKISVLLPELIQTQTNKLTITNVYRLTEADTQSVSLKV